MNRDLNVYDHRRGVINNDVNINSKNIAEECNNEDNNVYANNEQGRMNSTLQQNLS